MSDWVQKHLYDVAVTAEKCSRDPRVPPSHQQSFGEIYLLAKNFSMSPPRGRISHVQKVVIALCAACMETGRHVQCNGRMDWRLPCPMISQQLYQDDRAGPDMAPCAGERGHGTYASALGGVSPAP